VVRLLETLERRSRRFLILAGLGVLVVIGIIDYLTGYEMLFSVFYLLEVGLAAWFVGKGFGLFMSVLSALVWIGGDLAAGARYANPLIPAWNALIVMVFYFIVVWLLTSLRAFHRELEATVRQRTQALTLEMAERQRLEEEILRVGERERRRIGHDLHDSLCQHLTGTALAGQVLGERLAAKSLPEAADAGKVVELVEEGIALARNLARGLYPLEMEAEGLMVAFRDLAANTTNATTPINTNSVGTWRPDVMAAEAAVRKAEADLRFQKAVRVPDPTLQAQYEHQPPDNPNSVGFMVSLPVPLWNRNRGNILAAEAAREQARLAFEKAKAEAMGDIAVARLAYEDALKRWRSYRESIRPKSEQIRQTKAYAYQKGGTSLLDLLVAERNDNDIRLAAAQAAADTASAGAAFKAATEEIKPSQVIK
jgi:low affinity Fe/Cu permease